MGSVREALERLPGELRLGRGGLRLFAEFQDGKLDGPVKAAVFRVPPHAAHAVDGVQAVRVDAAVLEWVAGELQLDHGHTELVVEYADQGDGLHLHWIDFSWSLA